jgi:hypothetical protein
MLGSSVACRFVALFGVGILLYAGIMPRVRVQKYIGSDMRRIVSGALVMPVDTYSTIETVYNAA